MNIFSDLLDDVFRQTNGFVIHVVLARFAVAFVEHYATQTQIRWFSKKFNNLIDDSIKYYNMACTIKQYDYDDLEAIAEAYGEAFGSVPEGINEAFQTICNTEDRQFSYLQLSRKVSPFHGKQLKKVLDSLLFYLGHLESYKHTVLNNANQLDYERLHDDSEEAEKFREKWDDLITFAVLFVEACMAADKEGLINVSAIDRLVREVGDLALQFLAKEPIRIIKPSSVIRREIHDHRPQPTVMFSYSYDSETHKKWVRDFATELRTYGAVVILDQWDLRLGQDINYFMENIWRADNVIIICTPNYKQKADGYIESGVNKEIGIIREIVLADVKQTKCIPLLREGTKKTSLPNCLTSRKYVSCVKEEERVNALEEIMKSVFQIPNSMDIYKSEGILSEYLKL